MNGESVFSPKSQFYPGKEFKPSVVNSLFSGRSLLQLSLFQRIPITRDLPSSKELDKVMFWWTPIKQKRLKLF